MGWKKKKDNVVGVGDTKTMREELKKGSERVERMRDDKESKKKEMVEKVL